MRRLRWRHAFRILPTRFPPVPLFERLGDPATWEVLAEVEALTNPRIREEIGRVAHVPVAERVAGPGASWVMGSFAHRRASRFSDGSFGVYYCADREATAIAETRWHMGRFYAATGEPPLDVEMRVLVGAIVIVSTICAAVASGVRRCGRMITRRVNGWAGGCGMRAAAVWCIPACGGRVGSVWGHSLRAQWACRSQRRCCDTIGMGSG